MKRLPSFGLAGQACIAVMLLVNADLPASTADAAAQTILVRHGKREVRLHDPSTLVRCGSNYWLFATGVGLASWRSPDLTNWVRGPRVFETPPAWITNVVATQRGHFWAPDVIRHRGRYLLYYSVSRFGLNTSAIALASNPTLDPADPQFRWTDHGIVIQSGTNDDFNAIDPAVIATPDERLWLAFGSFWSGIKLVELDPITGKGVAPDSPLRSLANCRAIEAASIFAHGGYFHMFVNWDACCRGTNSTYNLRVGRSRTITGPYLDREGRDLLNGGGTLLSGGDGPFIGPGHAGILEESGRCWLSCHFYDGTQAGQSSLAIQPLRWDAEGWPVLAIEGNEP